MRRGIALHLDVPAPVATQSGEMTAAAQLCVAADATRESEGLARWHETERAPYGPAHAAARAALGEATFAAAWEAGKALPPVDLRAMALTLEAEVVAPIAATAPHTR